MFVVICIMFVICTYVFGYQLPLYNFLIYVPPIIGQCGFRFLTLNLYPQSYIFLLCHIVCIVNIYIYIYVCMVEINHYHYHTINADNFGSRINHKLESGVKSSGSLISRCGDPADLAWSWLGGCNLIIIRYYWHYTLNMHQYCKIWCINASCKLTKLQFARVLLA